MRNKTKIKKEHKINIPEKKYNKRPKIPPKGFKSSNDFFNYTFENKDLIWMGQNTNHLHDEDNISDAMIECLKEKEYCKYPAPDGFPELKELILKDLDLEDMSVYVTAGATESLHLCMHSILEPKDNVITCDPGYLIIGSFAERFAKEVKYVPIYNKECNYKLTPELIRENIDENTKIIVLIDPLNPLGTAYTEEEIKEIAQIAIENDIYLIHDVTYKDFARKHTLVAKYAPNNTLTIFSFSKIFGMAGVRLGAVVAPEPLIATIKNVVVNDLGVNIIAQKGGIAALKSKPKWIKKIRETTFHNQELIKDMVDTVDGVYLPVYPVDANMMVIDLTGAGIKAKDMSSYLLKKDIFTREGNYTSKLYGDDYLRISFSIPTEEIEVFCQEFPKAVEALRTK
ncbi:pyridoxal phosphate-dependent aminotransferase [Methanobrevibacter boviskoreani]|uniref:pyridoxal phosphate-dependent aminotransferase n=1 Tax=Methanobrevibacter boviskoreani TaxID=1348249 RepID=UPI0023A8C2AD|nr:pyridoxal phosphate-dependent aminotransferase [Methanobrevibacter boviskoreani]MCI6774773.1 pyridoxal phosphate-dependent aminotransferase [Methanobrevibacter boviskoreani]MDY5615096.1 pyridoxal phosphate-dependent aminotransferase [Methanobrevibacter boviskoreani]